ncbi:MAG: PAS domain-containing protein [Bryobacteraceae bacterium]
MLWLFLLAALTLVVINRRRIIRQITPLNDELYSSRVAVEHVHSGVGWVRASDGKLGSVNQSLSDTIGAKPGELLERDWYQMFPRPERPRVNEAYTQMLLAGIASIDTLIERGDGVLRPINLRLVAVHDHKLRLVGHHCMVHDESKARLLEQQVHDLAEALSQVGYELVPPEETAQQTTNA